MTSVLFTQVAQSELFLPALRHTATLLSSLLTAWITLPTLSSGLRVLPSYRNGRAGGHYE
jgi:hypothetical protein